MRRNMNDGLAMEITLPYADWIGRWVATHFPTAFLGIGPFGLRFWQWLALPILVILAWLLGYGTSRLLRYFLGRVVQRTAAAWDNAIVQRISEPLTLGCTLVIAASLLPILALEAEPYRVCIRLIHAGVLLAFFWSLWRLADVGSQMVSRTRWARESAASRSLVPLGVRTAKFVVLALTIVAVLSAMGFPIASVIAGLGIGGLAVALAAQKTVENLFGAYSLGVDQPFREGDFVKVEDVTGTVEAIGLRSTRIRTLDRTIVTMPNGKLADMRLESFTARDRLRLATVIGLTYDTTPDQMREVLAELEQVLRNQPKIWPDAVVVKFREFAASSLDIEIMAWFQTSEWSEFQTIRQEVFLHFMDVIRRTGTSFAFPTRTLHLIPPILNRPNDENS
jgi:MscS family membrane protein